MNKNMQITTLSSLVKVFPDEEMNFAPLNKATMMSNEVYSFQAAYHWNDRMLKNVKIEAQTELSPWVTLRKVALAPSEMPCYWDHDDNILRTTPGLYPDPLMPLDEEGIKLLPGQWRSIWIQVDPKGQAKAGVYPIKLYFRTESGDELGEAAFKLEIINANLPRQRLIHTQWFHTDCLATAYNVEVFSPEHWNYIELYIKTAVKHGINMILTPIFTPPLDTAIGRERPTVQLIDVEKSGSAYSFKFEKLKRWVDICKASGVQYFEFSHLFTQWGAKHAPKIIATEDGQSKQIFGWDTDSGGKDYKHFLSLLLPALIEFIKQNNLEKCSFFHISDEPTLEHLETYKNVSLIIEEHLKGFPIIDALSDYEFYRTGVVKNPIPASNHIDSFLENNVPNLWTYYCCSQYHKVSNRFFNMPSARNRIIGIQLYKFNIYGFLHWGYNFWYSQFSLYPIDPFCSTDAGCGFPSGDAFVVYPGKDGPVESLRLEVFFEALQDLRALILLEGLIGREAVLEIVEEGLDEPITFSSYPTGHEWLLQKREQVNRMIADHFILQHSPREHI